MRKSKLLFVGLVFPLLITSCGNQPSGPSIINVESITLNETEVSLYVGETFDLTATVMPEEATLKDVNWNVDLNTVVSVDVNGHVEAVGEGTAVVSAISALTPTVYATCTFTVSNLIDNISLNQEEELKLWFYNETDYHQSFQFKTTITPNLGDRNQGVIWSIEDESAEGIATISENGLVTAGEAEGSAVVVATSVIDPSLKARCPLTISAVSYNGYSSFTQAKVASTGNQNEGTLYVGTFDKLSPSNYLYTGPEEYTYSSSNPAVVKVDEYGNVMVLKAGSAALYVTPTPLVGTSYKSNYYWATVKENAQPSSDAYSLEVSSSIELGDIIMIGLDAGGGAETFGNDYYQHRCWETFLSNEQLQHVSAQSNPDVHLFRVEMTSYEKAGADTYTSATGWYFLHDVFTDEYLELGRDKISYTNSTESPYIGMFINITPASANPGKFNVGSQAGPSSPYYLIYDWKNYQHDEYFFYSVKVGDYNSNYQIRDLNIYKVVTDQEEIYPESVTLNKGIEFKTVNQYASKTLEYTLSPANVNKGKDITWTSSDPETIYVTAHGVVMGIKPGAAIITASTVNKDGKTISDSIEITVMPANI